MLEKMSLIPSEKKGDPIFNRRLLAYYGLAFSVAWFLMVFWTDVFVTFDVGKVIAYLGVPATIAGLGFWEYLKAARKSDEKPPETPIEKETLDAGRGKGTSGLDQV